jgi:hypothetical protein
MNTVASQINKLLLELHFIYWFVHPSTVPPKPPKALGFLRDNEGRAFIIGGLAEAYSLVAKFVEPSPGQSRVGGF